MQARSEYLESRISEALQSKKNIWKELRSLQLLPATKDDLHGSTPDELNSHFASVSVSQDESEEEMKNAVSSAAEGGFFFKEVTLADVVLAVSHFSSQAVGEDGIPQSVIAKSLPITGPILTAIINESLSSGAFPGTWRRANLVPLKKTVIP